MGTKELKTPVDKNKKLQKTYFSFFKMYLLLKDMKVDKIKMEQIVKLSDFRNDGNNTRVSQKIRNILET